MPNAFAYLVLLSFPLVAVLLFRLLPLQRALIWTLLSGHLLLPSSTFIKIPMLPQIDRALVPAVSALVLCLLLAPRMTPARDLSARTGRQVTLALVGLVFLTPFLTVLQNTEPMIDGRAFLPGLQLYDAFSMLSSIFVNLIPLWLGLRYLNTREGHKALLEAIVISGVLYTFPALLEIRISPQLHSWIYGFFPHDFIQHIRDGGFRPVVLLNHGLMVGIYFCMAIISSAVLYREARREGHKAWPWLLSLIWLVGVLYLSKSLGALVLAVIFGATVLLFGRRVQMIVALAVAIIVMFYPMLRGAGWIPVETVYNAALSISEDRAASLKFRLDNEDALLAHANEKPLFGWGSWGRNQLFDPDTGGMISTTDGVWIIFIGVFGWIGYIGRFGLLTMPILSYFLRQRTFGPSLITPGMIMVLSALLVDLLPNAGLVNYVWLMAGAVTGYVLWRDPRDSGAVPGDPAAAAASARATWLMAEETVVTSRQSRSERPAGVRDDGSPADRAPHARLAGDCHSERDRIGDRASHAGPRRHRARADDPGCPCRCTHGLPPRRPAAPASVQPIGTPDQPRRPRHWPAQSDAPEDHPRRARGRPAPPDRSPGDGRILRLGGGCAGCPLHPGRRDPARPAVAAPDHAPKTTARPRSAT
jgi:hypothetical protein